MRGSGPRPGQVIQGQPQVGIRRRHRVEHEPVTSPLAEGRPAAVIALAGSLVLAGVFGAVRAATVRVWIQDGQPWVQGTVLTAVLWLAAIAAHFGYDYLVARHKGIGQIGSATVLLYLVASLGAQALVVAWRARRLGPAGPARASPRPPRRGS